MVVFRGSAKAPNVTVHEKVRRKVVRMYGRLDKPRLGQPNPKELIALVPSFFPVNVQLMLPKLRRRTIHVGSIHSHAGHGQVVEVHTDNDGSIQRVLSMLAHQFDKVGLGKNHQTILQG